MAMKSERKRFRPMSAASPAARAAVRPVPRFTPQAATAELKFFDLDVDDAVVAAGGTILSGGTVNQIRQGVGESQHVGRKCTVRTISWRFSIKLPGSTTASADGSTDTVRVMLYLDKQSNGAVTTAAAILATDNYQSFNNLSNKGRFRTLSDTTHTLQSGGGAPSAAALVFSEARVDISVFKAVNIPLEFGADAGAITDLRSNNIGVLILSEAGVCAFDSKLRLRFTDS